MILRQMREDAGIHQADLARKLGKPQSFVSRYEAGERRLDLIELRQVCQVLGTSLTACVQRFERDQ